MTGRRQRAALEAIARAGEHELPPARATSVWTTGAAGERFARERCASVRFDPVNPRWLVYQEDLGYWRAQPKAGGEPLRLLRETQRDWTSEANLIQDDDRRKRELAQLLKLDETPKLEQALRAARAYSEVEPSALDTHRELIVVRNGVLNLRTGQVSDHDPALLMTRLVDVAYDPKAKAPRFEQFMKEVIPSKPVRDFVQRSAGYWLTGLNEEQFIWVFWGDGANGKSTFVFLVRWLLGAWATLAPQELLVSKRGYSQEPERLFARFPGRRLIVCKELKRNDRLNEDLIKQATGDDYLSRRALYSEVEDFQMQGKLVLPTNERPVITGTDHGIWRRMLLVPWEVTIPEQARDPRLLERLKDETPGVLAWLVRGARSYFRSGLRPPKAVLKATEQYRRDEDVVGVFLADACEVGDRCAAPPAAVYEAYQEWCRANGRHALGSRSFYEELYRQDGVEQDRSNGERIVRGVQVRGLPDARDRSERRGARGRRRF